MANRYFKNEFRVAEMQPAPHLHGGKWLPSLREEFAGVIPSVVANGNSVRENLMLKSALPLRLSALLSTRTYPALLSGSIEDEHALALVGVILRQNDGSDLKRE